MSRLGTFFGYVALGTLISCQVHLELPATLSPSPRPSPGAALRAGFARVDITPPPGVGLAGNGPEGGTAHGYRLRLYARVLVLADAGGNRLAIVVADMPLGSALLHRRVAALTALRDGIGVDRLVIAATHTHSGPGHYFEAAAYNDQASTVVGYDPVMVDSLAERIARTVHAAVADLRPARAAWGSRRVWGYTRIRSVPAMRHNIPAPVAASDAPTGLFPEYRLVDPELSMLRVDQRDSDGTYRPRGAFSIFAMHGTGNAPANDLLDADIHGVVERRLERHMERLTAPGSDTAFVPRAFYLFANGAEGDVSPDWPPQSRCDVPSLAAFPVLDGPFTPQLWQWRPPPATHIAACEHAAREAVERIGDSLGSAAAALFDSLAGHLAERLELGRAFVTLALRDSATALGVCPEPAVGMPTLVGAADSYSRMRGWRLFGVLSIGLEQGSPNPDVPGCHAHKRKLLDDWFGNLPNRLAVSSGLPSYAQVSVFRVGDRLIGTLPAEATTTAGRRMREQMIDTARARGLSVSNALIMGLTNGYVEYITTPEEYTAQYYEGASTLYGPGEAALFGTTLAMLTAQVSSGDTLRSSQAVAMRLDLGHSRKILPRRLPSQPGRSRIESVRCSGDTLYARASFGRAGDWAVSSGDIATTPRVAVVRDDAGRSVVSWDDDPKLELRLVGDRRGLASWEVRWAGARGGRYRVRLADGSESDAVTCRPTA